MDRSRADSKNLFLGVWDINTVHLRIVNLFEVLAIHTQTQAFGQNFVRRGKIKMDRLSGLGIVGA
jgi:hypothetical protein